MISYVMYGEPAPFVTIEDRPTGAAEKARLPCNRRNIGKVNKPKPRPWHSDNAIIQGSARRDTPPVETSIRSNKGFRLRMERNRGMGSNQRPQTPGRKSTALSGVSKSSSYTIQGPSLAGIPRISTSSTLLYTTQYFEPETHRTAIGFAFIWGTWEGIKRGLQVIFSPLTRIFYTKTFADKSTSTRHLIVPGMGSEFSSRKQVKARVDTWQKGRPKVLQSKSSSTRKSSGVSHSKSPAVPYSANIVRVTRDPKTKMVTVWTAEKKKTARPKASAAPETRRWRF